MCGGSDTCPDTTGEAGSYGGTIGGNTEVNIKGGTVAGVYGDSELNSGDADTIKGTSTVNISGGTVGVVTESSANEVILNLSGSPQIGNYYEGALNLESQMPGILLGHLKDSRFNIAGSIGSSAKVYMYTVSGFNAETEIASANDAGYFVSSNFAMATSGLAGNYHIGKVGSALHISDKPIAAAGAELSNFTMYGIAGQKAAIRTRITLTGVSFNSNFISGESAIRLQTNISWLNATVPAGAGRSDSKCYIILGGSVSADAVSGPVTVTIPAEYLTGESSFTTASNPDAEFVLTTSEGRRMSPLDLRSTISYKATDGETKSIYAANNDITDTAEGWSWDHDNKILTLDGLDMLLTTIENDVGYGIELPDSDAKIVLKKGSVNSIKGNMDNGIYSPYSGTDSGHCFTITGEGTLDISTAGRGIGLDDGYLDAESGTLNAAGANCGIYSAYGILVNGGAVTAKGTGDQSCGIFAANNIINQNYAIDIKGGTVKAYGNAEGIRSDNGTTAVEGGAVTAEGTGTDSTGIGGKYVCILNGTVSASGSMYGISTDGAAVLKGTLDVSGKTAVKCKAGSLYGQPYLCIGTAASSAILTNAKDADGNAVSCLSGNVLKDGTLLQSDTSGPLQIKFRSISVGSQSGNAVAGTDDSVKFPITTKLFNTAPASEAFSVIWKDGSAPSGVGDCTFSGSDGSYELKINTASGTPSGNYYFAVSADTGSEAAVSDYAVLNVTDHVVRTRALDFSNPSGLTDDDGTAVTADSNGVYACRSEGWSWDSNSSKLTLNGFVMQYSGTGRAINGE